MTSITTSSSAITPTALRLGEDSFSRRVEPKPLSTTSRAPDRVELSDAARQAASGQAPVRLDLVSRVREQIAAGTYDTTERTDVAASDMTRALRAGR